MSFLRDAANTLVLQILAAAFQLASAIVLSRSLQKEGSGLFSLVTLLPTIAVYVASFGYGSAAMRGVAKEPDHDGAEAGNTLFVGLVAGSALALLVALAAAPIRAFIGEGCEPVALALALAAIPILTLDTDLGFVLMGMHRIATSNAVKLLQTLFFFGAIALLWLLRQLTPTRAVVAWLASYVVSDLVAWGAVVRSLHSRVLIDASRLATGLAFGLKTLPGNLAMFLLLRVDLFLLRNFRDTGEVGVYGRATQLAMMFQLAARAIERAFLPRVMKASAAEAAQLTPAVTRSFMFVMTLVAAVAAALAFPLVPFFFGEGFRPAALQFTLFLPGILVANVGFLCNGDLMSRGRPGAGAAPAIVSLAVNVALNWAIIPRFGAEGAAVDSLVCYALYGVLVAGRYARATGVRLVDLFVPRSSDVAGVAQLVQRALRRTSSS